MHDITIDKPRMTPFNAFVEANDRESLSRLLQAGNQESAQVEWKKSTAQLVPAFQSLCAFLNNGGGIVLIGIRDDGTLLGQVVSDKTRQELAVELTKIEPYPHVSISYIPINATHQIIKLIASPDAQSVPYAYDARPYDPHESSTVRMTQIRYTELIQHRLFQTNPWDKLPAQWVKLEALDVDLMKRVWEAGIYYGRINKQILADSPELMLKRFNLLREDGQLTNAAVVLFCKEMPIDYSNCEIKLAAFNSIRREHIIDSRIVQGNLFTLLEEADAFIRRHTPISSWIPPDQFERIDQPAYIFEALREAVVNALCHRNYHGPGSVSVMFYQDRLEITSFGHLLPPLTISTLLSQAQSFPRNEKIAQVLYLCGEIERFGSGLQKILQLCEQAGAVAPKLEENNAFFSITFTPLEALPLVKERQKHMKSLPEVSERQRRILRLLSVEGPLSLREIVKQFTGTERRTIIRDLAVLAKIGLARKEGNGRNVTWQRGFK